MMKKATLAVLIAAFLSVFLASALFQSAASPRKSGIILAPGETELLDYPVGTEFASSHPLIASVSLSGVVTALTPGTAEITITTQNESKTVLVTVSGQPVTSLAVAQTEAMLLVGEEWALRCMINSDATDMRLIWASSDDSVVRVSDSGILTAVAPGSARITVSAMNGRTAYCEVTVVTPE